MDVGGQEVGGVFSKIESSSSRQKQMAARPVTLQLLTMELKGKGEHVHSHCWQPDGALRTVLYAFYVA